MILDLSTLRIRRKRAVTSFIGRMILFAAISFAVESFSLIPPHSIPLQRSNQNLVKTQLQLSYSSYLQQNSPAPPALKSLPLPVKLAGGLILFSTSVRREDQEICESLLDQAQQLLNRDPLIQMELGSGLELGGVFASASAQYGPPQQQQQSPQQKRFVCEVQVNGGNSWAQARIYGISSVSLNSVDEHCTAEVKLLSLQVANMDASLNGGWLEVPIPGEHVKDVSRPNVATKGYQSIEEWHDRLNNDVSTLNQLKQNQAQWEQTMDKWTKHHKK